MQHNTNQSSIRYPGKQPRLRKYDQNTQMNLEPIITGLTEVLSPELEIERVAAAALKSINASDISIDKPVLLHPSIEKELTQPDVPVVCKAIARTPLPWTPPTISNDPAYVALGKHKVHVELLGPGGLIPSDQLRVGLYGLLPDADYGIRTHPAEEVFVMLAGESYWRKGDNDYQLLKTGERSFHPSMMPHATRTGSRGFLSVYVWCGDISTDNYTYIGSGG